MAHTNKYYVSNDIHLNTKFESHPPSQSSASMATSLGAVFVRRSMVIGRPTVSDAIIVRQKFELLKIMKCGNAMVPCGFPL